MPRIEVVSTGLVYRNPKPYLRSVVAYHPSLLVFEDGEIVVTHDLGEAVEALNYATYVSRSADGGQTWTLQGRVLPDPPSPRRSSHSVRTSRAAGGLVGFGGLYYRDNPDEGLVNRANLGYVPMDLFLTRSADRGRTWSAPEIFQPPLVSPAWETCHSIIELPSGRWLAPTATWRGWNGDHPAGEQTVVLISDDQGRTWPRFGRMFDGRATGIIHWEVSVVPLADGRIMAVTWVHDPATGKSLPSRYTISHDQGETWQPSRETGFLGETCKGTLLPDGRVLCAYRRTDKPGLWAVLATLDGDRWASHAEAPLWQGAASGLMGQGRTSEELSALRFGYPSLKRLPDGDVFLVFWCVEDLLTVIRWVRLRVRD